MDLSNPNNIKQFIPINDLEEQICAVEMYVSGYHGSYPSEDVFVYYMEKYGSNGFASIFGDKHEEKDMGNTQQNEV